MTSICEINSSNPILQVLYTSTGNVSSTASQISASNSIPNTSEGVQLFSLTITPRSATSILVVEFSTFTYSGNSNEGIFALFRDSGVNAIAASFVDSITGITSTTLNYVTVAGSTAATTFKVRFGPSSAEATTCYINSDESGGRLYGGVASTVMSIKEFGP